MKKKKYIVNGQVYEIPDEESGAFLKDFPDAKVQYDIEGKQYEIPHQETEAFETDMGLKKKSGGNDGSNISETALSNGQADGEIPIVSLDAENKAHPIDLAAEYTGLKNKTIIEGTGEGEMEVPDVAGRKKGEDLKEFLKIQHGIEDPENLYEENKDFPQNASDWKFTDESGVEVQPYSKDNRLKLRETNPTAYYDKINGVKTQYAIAEKTGNWSLANEFINLKKSAQNVDEFVGNVNKQKEIINTVFDDKDEREKANERLKSEAYVISPAAKGFTESYKNSGLSDKLSPYEYSGLLTLKAFEPEKYEQTVNFINTPITEKYSHQLPTEALRNMQAPVAIGTSFESPQKNVNGSVGKLSQQTVDEKLGLETRMRELSDIGQSNYFQSIQKDNAELNEEINKLDDADENKTLLINKYNSNVSDLNKAIAESENDDAKYPLTTALKFDKQVADMTQQEPGLLNTAAIKFALQTDKPRKAFENIFGDSPSLQMQRVGEEESNSKFTYLPEEYIRQNSPVIPVYPKELEKEIKAISANKEMPFQERQAKIKELLIANQSKIKTITNPNEGKSKNFFSKATAYTMADFMGNIGGMAFTMAALPIKGLPKEMVGMGLLFHNDHYTEAVKKGIPNPNEYANLHSGIDMLAGSFGTQYQTVKKLISTNPSTKNILNGITEEMWDKVVSKDKAFISKISNAAKSSLKDNTKMVAMWGGAVPAFHNVANNAFGNENKSASDILNESVASMKEMAVGQLPLAVAGVYSGYKRESTLRKSLLWDIGDNADIELQRVKDLEATGKLTPEKATQRTQTIKEVSKLIDLVPSTDKKGKPLNDEARMDYLYNLYVKNKVKTESGLPEKQKVEAEKTGMVADHINNEILDPSTDKQLESRLNQIEKELEPEVGADGKTTPIPEKEKTKLEAEKEAINQVIEERKQPEPVKEPSTVSKITADAEDLLKSVDSGSKPAFVTKNMERIAKENGIEVTDKTTPDEIINQLKSKQESKPSTVSSGDALKDVESTEKALRKIKDDNQIGMNKSKEYPKESALFNEVYSLFPFARKEGKSTTSFTDVSEAYHKAKRDGSNPEFVKAVEDLINKEQPIAPKQEAKPTVSSGVETPVAETNPTVTTPTNKKERLAAFKKNYVEPAPAPQTEAEVKKEWNQLSMAEKLALAKENLPQPDNISNAEIVALADRNAKMLLAKLHKTEIPSTNNISNENVKQNEPIIADDPAENKIAVAKLTEQDNIEQEPNVKAIEQQAENAAGIGSKEIEKEIDKADELINAAIDVVNVPISEIKTNEKEYQGRKNKFSERSANNVAKNFDKNKLQPIVVYRHPDGNTYVLSGHSRLEGMKRRNATTIPATYFEGTPQEAIDFSQTSNKQATLQTDIENAAYYRKKLLAGESYNAVLKEAKENEQEGSAKRIVSIAHLNPNGKAMQDLEALDKGEGDSKNNILNIATKIGDIRAKNDHLTNAHENELYDFMVADKKNIPTDKDLANASNTLNRSINNAKFTPQEPLNLDRVVNKSANRIEWERELRELESQQSELKEAVNPSKKTGWTGLKEKAIATLAKGDNTKEGIDKAAIAFEKNENGIKDAYQKQLETKRAQLASVNDKLAKHLLREKDLIQGDKAQQSLFAIHEPTTQEISDMKDIVKDYVDEGTASLQDIQNEVAKELGDDSQEMKDLVEKAYNEFYKTKESTPIEVTSGVIGKVGKFLSRLFGGTSASKVFIAKNETALINKANELGGDIKYQMSVKAAELALAKAQRELQKAEGKISGKQVEQKDLFDKTAQQAQMFGIGRDEAKEILDPLRQKVREAKNDLAEAQNNVPKEVGQNLSLFMNDKGEILGFANDNKIYLNGERINPNSPIHEAGHIWTEWAKTNNPEVYTRGMQLTENSKYLKEVRANEFYKAEASKLGSEGSKAYSDYMKHEALAMAIGDKGAQFVGETRKKDFKEWLNNLWNKIKAAAGFKDITTTELQNLTFDEFTKRAAADILRDEEIAQPQNQQQQQGTGTAPAAAPQPRAKTKLTDVEVGVIREVLDKPIDAKEFPTFFDMNAIGKQQTAVTQEAGQDRAALDGTYVKAHLEDLRSISFNNARILQDALGKEWKEKLIGFLEDNPTAGNIAQVSGLLNVVNTDINNEIAKSKNGTEISKLKDLQARADRITYDTGRSASLALNQRRMYQDFGQGKDVVDILSAVILTPEQQAMKSKVEEALKQKFTDAELNKPKKPKPKKQQQAKQPKPATPKSDDSVKKDLISKGQKAAQQTDANGNVTIVSLKDKIQQANDALNGFKC